MYKKRPKARFYICGILLMTAAAFMGCSGKRRGPFVPVTGQSEEKDNPSGITIEIIGDGDEKSHESCGETKGEPPQEPDLKESHGQEEDETHPEETVSAGDILLEGDIQEMGADEFFTISPISDWVFYRMDGASYKEGCPVLVEDLRYLRILHYDFDGNIRVGELVCNKSVSEDMLGIFRQLYEAQYPIDKVRLIDDYGGDDDLSSMDNNTSCFNYRTVANSSSLSLHALGVAVDINPVYNPYITWNEEGVPGCAPSNGAAYMDRSQDFPYKIDEDDLCCRLFVEAGFTWGGNWSSHPDYMHFSRGVRPEQ